MELINNNLYNTINNTLYTESDREQFWAVYNTSMSRLQQVIPLTFNNYDSALYTTRCYLDSVIKYSSISSKVL